MTLIEVLAGMVILGTVLTSVAIARGRFLRQWRDAEQKLVAGRAVDELIGGWMNGSGAPPVPGEGTLGEMPGYVWRTRYVPSRAADELNAAVVRVEVLSDVKPVMAVEILVHRMPLATTRPSRGQEK